VTYFADLHCHTTCSDGSFSPEELIQHAKKIGLKGLSITDHDTIDAYQIAVPAALKAGLHLGSGVEFSCDFHGTSIHLLGYDFDLNAPAINELCMKHRKRREERNKAILQLLAANKMPISYEELQSKALGNIIGRPHIAQVMLEKGYVKNLREAFNQYIGEGKKCYVQGEPFRIEEAIGVLHGAGGKAFVAHPQLLPNDFPVEELFKLPLDGLECYYSRLFKKSWVEIAESKGWLMSGGSDFHGNVKPETELGCSGVDEETFHRIFEQPIV
jgi:3',5'-nucleoside bisphosphate phosphatase